MRKMARKPWNPHLVLASSGQVKMYRTWYVTGSKRLVEYCTSFSCIQVAKEYWHLYVQES